MELIAQLKKEFTHPSNQRIEGELTHLLYSQAGTGIIASLLLATCLVFILYPVIQQTQYFLIWYGSMFIVAIFRYSLVKAYLYKLPSPEQSFFWKKLFVLSVGSAGILWAFAGTLFIPPAGIYQTFFTCTLAGVSGSAVPFFAGSRIATAVYTIPILLPYSIVCFMQDDTPHRALGIFIALFLLLLLFSSFRTYRVIYNAIKLKFENEDLIKNLSIAKKDMEIINQELQGEINERSLAEKLLRDSEEQYRLVTDALPVLISYIDMDFNYRYNNKAHEIWFGKSLDEITGKPLNQILGATSYAIFAEYFEKLGNKKQVSYETVMKFRDDEERYVSVTLISHIKDNVMVGLFSLISDMTPRINYLATHDALTDLPNRSLFNARFSQAVKRAHRHNYQVALFFLDLDHFKNINDTLGHDVGDHLLIKVVERVKNCLREVDTLSRLGGDEFTIIIENINTEGVVKVAEKIAKAFTSAFHLDGHDIFITVSMGISIYPVDGTDMQTLLRNSDMAIYRAKERGRNTYEFYTEDLNAKITKKQTIETQLRCALQKQEFNLHYQPVIDITNNTLCGLEALLRWESSEMGMISPADFIPVAEETGLIVPLGEWILRSVCAQNLDWHQTQLAKEIRTSINISPRQFRERNLVERIAEVLKENGISGEFITLELTESLIMQNIEYSAKLIKALKNLGIAISIDDFGTGYSSLNYLRKFPVDIIKIDRSFIIDVTINPEDAAIVRAIIAMAHGLRMKVIAEGVETTAQYNFLKEHGCNEVQGFLISKPLPVEEITTFLQNTNSVTQILKHIQSSYATRDQ
ncbi:MAG: putative bifunctional diguanylate cyclase/phosphodiesterase [Gammaproteobacteria bacterium]